MRSEVSGISDLLFGQVRGRLLAILLGRPDQSFFVRELSRKALASSGTVQRELTTLASVGIVNRSRIGSQVFFRANQDSPIYRELRALVAKTQGVFHLLRTAFEERPAGIAFAFVYGSFARGEEVAASDLDLMVVGDVTLDEVLDRTMPLERELGRNIQPMIHSPAEITSKLQSGNHFLRSVVEGKLVFVCGDEDEFRKMVGIRLA